MSEQGQIHSPTFGKVPPELMHDLTITDGAVRLYAHMHWRYGQNHQNYEGQFSMAKFLGISTTTVRNRIAELESKDWVVVVYRGFNKKTGNFTTPYYHVFVVQDECKAFRNEYKPAEGESIGIKPEAKERKLRKGVGGNPNNLHRANSSSDGQPNLSSDGGLNLSSDGHANSSSDNPEALYPDSSNPEPIKTAKKSRITQKDCDALIDVWASILKLNADAMGSNYHSKSARRHAKEMLLWTRPPTRQEFELVIKESGKDYIPFEFLSGAIIKLRAKKPAAIHPSHVPFAPVEVVPDAVPMPDEARAAMQSLTKSVHVNDEVIHAELAKSA